MTSIHGPSIVSKILKRLLILIVIVVINIIIIITIVALSDTITGSLFFGLRVKETRSRRIRPRRERPLGMLSDGLSYKCSFETCLGRLQTCFCNVEPHEFSPHKPPISLSSFSFFPPLALFSHVLLLLMLLDVALARSGRSKVSGFMERWFGIVGAMHVKKEKNVNRIMQSHSESTSM